MVVFCSGFQDGRWEIGLVGGVGEKLGFQTETMSGTVGAAAFSGTFFRDVIGGVEMNTGKGGTDFQGNAADGGMGFGGRSQGSDAAVNYIIVIVPQRIDELVEILSDAGTNGGRGAEVHGRACHRLEGSVGDAVGIAGGVVLCEDLNGLLQNGT